MAETLYNRELPIVPISAVRGINIDCIVNEIMKIPIPKRSLDKPPKFISIRSFDANKSGVSVDQLVGGIIGGTLTEGILKIGDIIEIRPGIIESKDGQHKAYPLTTKIISLKAEDNYLKYALPGGLIAIGTLLDPALTKQDKMVGQMIGYPGTLPPIVTKITIKFHILFNKDTEFNTVLSSNLTRIMKRETDILITVSGCNNTAKILSDTSQIKGTGDLVEVEVSKPICIPDGASVAISSKNMESQSSNWRLIGYGKVVQ